MHILYAPFPPSDVPLRPDPGEEVRGDAVRLILHLGRKQQQDQTGKEEFNNNGILCQFETISLIIP